MGQAKNRGTREQRVAIAEQQAAESAQRDNVAKTAAAMAGQRLRDELAATAARNRKALDEAAALDTRYPPARPLVIGGISPRMRLALAGLGELVDRVGIVSTSAATAAAVGDAQ